ncbi:hypothetical protein ZWY2020_035044 [Hordeum vulgare]|nr:hypothetical protein ZWY2020_035044 [Hordeum vulgare]
MVFEDESGDDTSSLPHMHSSSSTDGLNQDPEYKGLEIDMMVLCDKHGKTFERLVAFEGTYTWRRFLACAESYYRFYCCLVAYHMLNISLPTLP